MSGYVWQKLTERQQKRLEKIATELAAHGLNVTPQDFDITLHKESRAGRGHDITWWIYDEEKVAQGRLDPYGNGGNGYGVADVIWSHTGDDCDCDVCELPAEVSPDVARDLQRVAPDRPVETVSVAGGVL